MKTGENPRNLYSEGSLRSLKPLRDRGTKPSGWRLKAGDRHRERLVSREASEARDRSSARSRSLRNDLARFSAAMNSGSPRNHSARSLSRQPQASSVGLGPGQEVDGLELVGDRPTCGSLTVVCPPHWLGSWKLLRPG